MTARPYHNRNLVALLVAGYTLLALVPLALAWLQGKEPRPWRDELATALALTGFAMLLMEFLLSGRFKAMSARMGMDRIMQFHQIMAYVVVAFLLIHPFLYSLPMGIEPPHDPDARGWLRLPLLPGLSGLAAWLLLGLLVLLAIVRDSLPYRYETWRLTHGLGAALIALFGLHHATAAGRYSQEPALAGIWVVAVLLALVSLLHVHLVIPLRQRRHPYRVTAVRQEAQRTWTLELQPDVAAGHPGRPFPYLAGQFAWLKLERPLFHVTEHPFSISSAPSDRPRVAFTIKEAGDFTNTVSAITPGTRAYLDGPYGHFTLTGDDTRPLVLIGGGVGMAPLMSLLRELHAQGSRRPIRLMQGNRSAEQILFGDELETLRQGLNLTIHHVLSEPPAEWSGHTGMPDQALLEACIPSDERLKSVYYMCGPPEMIDGVESILLQDFRVPRAQVISERFRYTLGVRQVGTGRVLLAALWSAGFVTAGILFFMFR